MRDIASHAPRLKAMCRPKILGNRRSGRAGEPAVGESVRASESLDDVPQDPRLPCYPPVGPTDRPRDEPRNDRSQHSTDLAKDVQWHGLSRARRPPFRPGEVLDVGIHARTFYRTCSRIELPRPDFWAGSVGAGFSLSGFLRRFRLCPLAGLSFGHVFFAFPSCFVEL